MLAEGGKTAPLSAAAAVESNTDDQSKWSLSSCALEPTDDVDEKRLCSVLSQGWTS